jgi:spore germination cell wall hydrolase CwlJ-like protein
MLKFFLFLFLLIMFTANAGSNATYNITSKLDEPKVIWSTVDRSTEVHNQHPLLTWAPSVSNAELECMAKNIYFEAAVESTAGRLAVAQVTLNRVKSNKYPNTVCGVVYEGPKHASGIPKRDRCQFSWYCDGKVDEPSVRGKLWDTSHDLAKWVLAHTNLVDITDGATHYHATYIDPPRWAHHKTVTTTIDQHIFYKQHGFR